MEEDDMKHIGFSWTEEGESVHFDKSYEWGITWHEIMPDFFRFLNATGYIIPQEWIDDYCDYMESHKPAWDQDQELPMSDDELYNPSEEEWDD